MIDDQQLLHQYTTERSARALDQLILRYQNLVFSSALRQVRDRHLAEDVTQAVFLILAQKAAGIRPNTPLGGWLFTVTRHAAGHAMKKQQTRRRHEQAAARPDHAPDLSPEHWQQISPLLDAALAALPAPNRDAVILRYFQDQPYAQIASQLRLTPDAARKRVDRALLRLRARLTRRGIVLPAAALAAALTAHAVHAAPVLFTSASASLAAQSIAKGVTHMLAAVKMKLTAAAAIAILFAGASTAILVPPTHAQTAPTPESSANPTASIAPAIPASAPATAPYKIFNRFFQGHARGEEFAFDVDPETKRTPASEPAGYVQSLLPRYLPNDQVPGIRYFRGEYNDLHGKRVRLSAWLKTRDVEQWGGLILTVLGPDNQTVAAEDSADHPLHGTTDWTRQEIVLDIPQNAHAIILGSSLFGKGRLWSDDFTLEAVGPEVPLTRVGEWSKFSFFAASYTAEPDPDVRRNDAPSIRIASTPDASARQWISYNRGESDVARFRGHRITVTLWLKSTALSGASGPWINVTSPTGQVTNEGQKGRRPLRGTADWQPYTASVDVPKDAASLGWGVVINGTGTLWLDPATATCTLDDPPSK